MKLIKDLIVPIKEYATVAEDAILFEAVMALEKAQMEHNKRQYLHRAILVYDKNDKIVGKVSQLDILRAMEPKYKKMGDPEKLSRAGFSQEFLQSMLEKYELWDDSFVDVCGKAVSLKVKDIMYKPSEGEYVNEDVSLSECIHRLVMGHHQSLLVTRGEDIVGILRLTDVFNEIVEGMKACEV